MRTTRDNKVSKLTNLEENPILLVNDCRGRKGVILSKDCYTIGRSKHCSIILADPFVSRIHARILRFNVGLKSRFQILDGENDLQPSKNGILLDGKPVKNRILKPGDTLWLSGHTYIRFTSREELSTEEPGFPEIAPEFNAEHISNNGSEEITLTKAIKSP